MKTIKGFGLLVLLAAFFGPLRPAHAGPYPGSLPDHGHTRPGDGGLLTNAKVSGFVSSSFTVSGATFPAGNYPDTIQSNTFGSIAIVGRSDDGLGKISFYSPSPNFAKLYDVEISSRGLNLENIVHSTNTTTCTSPASSFVTCWGSTITTRFAGSKIRVTLSTRLRGNAGTQAGLTVALGTTNLFASGSGIMNTTQTFYLPFSFDFIDSPNRAAGTALNYNVQVISSDGVNNAQIGGGNFNSLILEEVPNY